MKLPPCFISRPSDPQFIDLTGQKWGRLTVLGYAGYSYWWCRCDCGAITKPVSVKLRRGSTKSCGCHRRDYARSPKKHGEAHTGKWSAEFKIWIGMRSRCHDPQNAAFSRYGAKGIMVCDRWRHSYENFLSDMGRKPTAQHQIDRWPNGAGNYEPGNCRWATRTENCRNRSSNRMVCANGKMVPLVEACELLGLNYMNMRSRLNKGFTWERAMTQPFRASRT